MRISVEGVIPPEKLARYLLLMRPWDDKPQFLGQGGFTLSNVDSLEQAIRQAAANF